MTNTVLSIIRELQELAVVIQQGELDHMCSRLCATIAHPANPE